jgi:REP element-mobilizing transposase RayT
VAIRRTDLLVRHIDDLRAAIKSVKVAHPFAILAMVVLPEHLRPRWRFTHRSLSDHADEFPHSDVDNT